MHSNKPVAMNSELEAHVQLMGGGIIFVSCLTSFANMMEAQIGAQKSSLRVRVGWTHA